MIVSLYGDENDDGNTTFNAGDRIVKEWGESNGTTIERFLGAGTYVLKVQNDTNRTSGIDDTVDASPVGFRIKITESS